MVVFKVKSGAVLLTCRVCARYARLAIITTSTGVVRPPTLDAHGSSSMRRTESAKWVPLRLTAVAGGCWVGMPGSWLSASSCGAEI
jgi:hypothetical protein